ncbi:hypothetical protein SEPCBS119000_004720 [Sporothrix epigloea]|uniref:Nima interactive protein n=1 Tax=Sporothrix epigloea TaxID=1892477 RepID=A0ABP0DVV4_9PEZI
MTDRANLQTASLYINNQLLSRGLLRDGQTIDFANPTGGAKEDASRTDNTDSSPCCNCTSKVADHTADTMARIISVVNDLILRRDRDAEHRESLSTALRTVRADLLRQTKDLQRAVECHAEAQRRADLGDAAETSLRAQLAAADAANRKLREEAARMRQQVAQTRASCANEVRKRDRQIDSLKKAVSDAGRARGERRNPAITTITITGAVPSSQQSQQAQQRNHYTPNSGIISSRQPAPITSTSSTKSNAISTDRVAAAPFDDDLRSETNAFLADLARGLSQDNELLVDLVRHTNKRLKIMSGYVGNNEEQTGDNATPPFGAADCGAMVVQMEAVLEHLQTILTNPSFVPIEEVVERESEIGRLRDGWEKMENRWKEAVHLLDGWRRRMATSGRPVNLEELQMGLRLSPVRVRNVAETTMGLDPRMRPSHAVSDDEDHSDEDLNDDDCASSLNWPTPGRKQSVTESLHIAPAPAADSHDLESDHDLSSDSESDSDFAEDADNDEKVYDGDQRRTHAPKETFTKLSHEAITTSDPLPPRPKQQDIPRVTAAANDKANEQQKKTTAEQSLDARVEPFQNTLQPSQTAGNRGGVDDLAPAAKGVASLDVKKGKTIATSDLATVTRGRRRPDEVEEVHKERKQVRIGAATADSGKINARHPTARAVASTATTTDSAAPEHRRANFSKAAVKRPVPVAKAFKSAASRPVPIMAQGKQRPASATSQASDTLSARSPIKAEHGANSVPATSVTTTSSRPVPTSMSHKSATIKSSSADPPKTDCSQSGGANQPASGSKTSAPSASSSSLEQAPPPSAPTSAAINTAQRARSRSPIKFTAVSAMTVASAATITGNTAPGGAASRLPLPTSSNIPPPPSPALNMASIAAKLAASEREADAARVRAKLKAARNGMAGVTKTKAAPIGTQGATEAGTATIIKTETEAEENVDPAKAAPSGSLGVDTFAVSNTSAGDDPQYQQPLRKKRDAKAHRRVSKAASRRRSTLNPWELKSLMSGNLEGAAPAVDPVAAAP